MGERPCSGDVVEIEGGSVANRDLHPIEGGSVEKKDLHPITVKGPFDVDQHRGLVTVYLIALLAVTILGHYVCVVVMEWNGKKVENLSNAFHVALPVIAGLASSAVAYYFTQAKGHRE